MPDQHSTHIDQVTGPVHTGSGNIVIGGEGAHVTVTIQGENVRDEELAYLDGLLKRYAYWRDHYTPLAGIAEVRAAVKDGPRLDLPMPFIPAGFEKLVAHGYGSRAEVRREKVGDLREAVTEHGRIVLLGDPGSGKTTTLWRLAYDYATAARGDAQSPLPVLVPLGGYTDDGPFDAYLAHHLGALGSHLETYRASGRLILLLDGLNEMPQRNYAGRVARIQDTIERYPDGAVVVTCRALDYVVELARLQRVEVSPLDEGRMRDFLHNYLGETAGERLFWAMAGDGVRELWDTLWRAGGTWEEFWTADEMPENVYAQTAGSQYWRWKRLQKEPPPLLALGRNPYLLLMTAQVYVGAGGDLPANRARLFAAFVDTLLEREGKRHPQAWWIEAGRQQEGLAALAYAMQAAGGRGTTVGRDWAVARLCEAAPGCDPERLLYLASSATLLDTGETAVRFYHHLLQEYFAAREMGRRVAAGEPLARYWPAERWWEPSGWEETAILLVGMTADAAALLGKLSPANPVVAARCLVEGGAQAGEAARRDVAFALVRSLDDERATPTVRAQAGRLLSRLGDPRPGVWVDAGTGLPDVVWCRVPAGPFTMGSGDDDGMAYGDEKPQHRNESITQSCLISRYPVTNAQFAPFVAGEGYRERRYWTAAGWEWKERESWTGPDDYGEPYNLDNHPVVGVSWYEAVAFCCWLTERFRGASCDFQIWRDGRLETRHLEPETLTVRLSAEAEWEKAARGTDGRIYPWGNTPDPNRANYDDAGIGTPSAVGCFPGGASPYGVGDLSGNVWEWTRSTYQDYPYDPSDGREDLDAGPDTLRVLRGGSFFSVARDVRCAYRDWNDPYRRLRRYGFRVIVASPVHL